MLGTMGKIFLFMFLIDMGFYLFAEQLGTDMLLTENDLFIKLINTSGDDIGSGELLSETTDKLGNVNESGLQSSQTSGLTSILTLFDPLFNLMYYIKLGFGTIINIFTAPLTVMLALIQKGAPTEISLLIFAPIILLTLIGFWSLLRGKDI